MINMNNYQVLLFDKLSSINISVYDKVEEDAKLPFLHLGDYKLSLGNAKYDDYKLNQVINVWSDYEGKKEVNDLLNIICTCIQELNDTKIDELYSISDIKFLSANVYEIDGYYKAEIEFEFFIEE